VGGRSEARGSQSAFEILLRETVDLDAFACRAMTGRDSHGRLADAESGCKQLLDRGIRSAGFWCRRDAYLERAAEPADDFVPRGTRHDFDMEAGRGNPFRER
jgi:hypothetical protein